MTTLTEVRQELAEVEQMLETDRMPTYFERLQVDTVNLSQVLRREVRPVLKDLGTHVAKAVNAGGGLVLEDAAANRVDYIVTLAGLGTYAERRFGPLFRLHAERVAYKTVRTIERSFGLRVDPAAVAKFVLEMGGRRAGLLDLTGDTKAALFRILDQAREEGVGVKKLGRQVIADHVGAGRFVHAGPQYRGQLIARTETLHAQRVAALTTCRVSGKVQQVLAFDGDEDEDCAARNGEYFTLDEADIETDAEHPNGTLAWGPIVMEEL